ncbi:cytochrome c3 family protein [Nitrospirillum viridazoti]|uniref:Cytochrome C n=1 Tax=Nitrospirillum viridazoti CBAmc TaxID=1441467 RepID=A0A248K183_9PROT|nr:cytochrome c3 family protein [Nitrospirillum amazonense]ASG24194.1 cytochrome C [Nitrospirillum amazonense CBAmc]TWB40810.1 quinol:cytochrome c oxidoreductase pentaheme cytochrome subunit [Nitrospirillum amazonense]
MPQIFTASADTWLRAGVLLAAMGVLVTGLLWDGAIGSSYITAVGWVRDQPVPFSHKHHVGDVGIDCRYCHTTVETGPHAGFPATHTCMTCHSQLWTSAPALAPVRDSLATGTPIRWQRVARLPDYVYFNHSIHVARGVPCVTCHGRVDQMPLMMRAQPFQMRWCLDCHRDPGPHLRPPDQVTRMDWRAWDREGHADYGPHQAALLGIKPERMTDCTLCHR